MSSTTTNTSINILDFLWIIIHNTEIVRLNVHSSDSLVTMNIRCCWLSLWMVLFIAYLISHEFVQMQLKYVASGEPQFDLLQWERYVFLLGEFQGQFWDCCVLASRQQNHEHDRISQQYFIGKKWWMKLCKEKMTAELLLFSKMSRLILLGSHEREQIKKFLLKEKVKLLRCAKIWKSEISIWTQTFLIKWSEQLHIHFIVLYSYCVWQLCDSSEKHGCELHYVSWGMKEQHQSCKMFIWECFLRPMKLKLGI